MWYETLNSTIVALGSAVTVDALSSLRGVMSVIWGTFASASAATCGLWATWAWVATYCCALPDDVCVFDVGLLRSSVVMRSSAVAWKTGACRDEMKYVTAVTRTSVVTTIHHPRRITRT